MTRVNFSKDSDQLQRRLKEYSPNAPHYTAQFLVSELIGQDRRHSIKYLEDKSVFLFAGIGNFKPLKQQVEMLCADLDYALELSDHQVYDKGLLNRIKMMTDKYDSDVIITTGKDWVKLPDFAFGREIYYLSQAVDLDPGEERLVRYVLDKLDIKGGTR